MIPDFSKVGVISGSCGHVLSNVLSNALSNVLSNESFHLPATADAVSQPLSTWEKGAY